MAFDPAQLRLLIRDTLRPLGLHSQAAEELLLLTAAVESNLGTYLYQINGPARGIFQMEPATHDDIWRNYVEYKEWLKEKLPYDPLFADADTMVYNLRYAIIMARLHYLRVPTPLPHAHDVKRLAVYWKVHYNTVAGRGTTAKAIEKYKEFVNG